jgi:predicted alpha/beta hydrolase
MGLPAAEDLQAATQAIEGLTRAIPDLVRVGERVGAGLIGLKAEAPKVAALAVTAGELAAAINRLTELMQKHNGVSQAVGSIASVVQALRNLAPQDPMARRGRR